MNNFLNFIEKDVEAKKTLISTLPVKTKTNIKHFNEKLEEMEEKYNGYKESVRTYIMAKNDNFQLPAETKNVASLADRVSALEHVKFLLNPMNTFIEKLGFDELLFQLNNYYVFKFKTLDTIINKLLDKFEMLGVKLNEKDFDYTCFVHEYMTSFLRVRNDKTRSYDEVSEVFEKIYWLNPELIEHIELNFRKLIRKNAKRFNAYIEKLQREALEDTGVKNYDDCLYKLQAACLEYNEANKESINEIIALFRSGEIDINKYMPDSKFRKSAFDSLIDPSVDLTDQKDATRIYNTLIKLRENVEEFGNYNDFLPLLTDFVEKFRDLLPKEKVEYDDKKLKETRSRLITGEGMLEKLNKKISSGKTGLFSFSSEKKIKDMKMKSIHMAQQLYELYKVQDRESFKKKVATNINESMTVSDFLNIYYSYDYFKKLAIRKVYEITDYDEVIKYAEKFDLFAINPTNIIATGVPLFVNHDVTKIIANKYRLSNINISDDDLAPENLKALENKISLILRVNTINNSSVPIDRIWFMVNVDKIKAKEEAEKATLEALEKEKEVTE